VTAISFTVNGVAATAGSKKGFYNKTSGRVIITDDSARSRPWKAQVSDAAAEAMTFHSDDGTSGYRTPLEGPLHLQVVFWITRPKGHFGTGRNAGKVKAGAPWAPTVKPDLLKLARAVEDALTGIVYRDDAQIVTEYLQKVYTPEGARTDVRVAELAAPDRPPVTLRREIVYKPAYHRRPLVCNLCGNLAAVLEIPPGHLDADAYVCGGCLEQAGAAA
jgi:Holliday junction resolvase RusA-like endonuclease